MAGEMNWINQDGEDNDGNVWEIHAAIAKAVNGKLEPFDRYQGPYIVVGPDVRVGNTPYAMPVRHLGVVRLWVSMDDNGLPVVYREDTDETCPFLYDDIDTAPMAARSLLGMTE